MRVARRRFVVAAALVLVVASAVAVVMRSAPEASSPPPAGEFLVVEVRPEEAGETLFAMQGCDACHTVDGTELVGASLAGIFGRERVLEDGSRVVADEAYLKAAILDPKAHVVKGYPAVMPSYAGKMSDDHMGSLLAYLKSLEPVAEPATDVP